MVSKQKDKSEVFFRRLLKEDKGTGQWEGITYIDFLCQIHREIKEMLNWNSFLLDIIMEYCNSIGYYDDCTDVESKTNILV